MENKPLVYLNGDFIPWEQATVHIMSHSVGRGSAIFEVLSFHETVTGPAVFRLDKHVTRFFRSAELLEMDLPLTEGELYEAVRDTVRRTGLVEGFIKIIGFYPQISFEILPPSEPLSVVIFAFDPNRNPTQANARIAEGSSACISQWHKLDPCSVPIEAKVAANYLNGMMARLEARSRGFDYAVLLDSKGYVAEGGTESVLLVKNGTIFTPALGTVLDSITRKSLLQAARANGIETVEEMITPEFLHDADEIFLGGTLYRVRPISRLEDRIIEGTPGPVTRRVSAMMETIARGRDERFREWLFPVGK